MTRFDVTNIDTNAVHILDGEEALITLRSDINDSGPLYAYTYLIDVGFWHELMSPHTEHSEIYVLTDHRQLTLARALVQENRRTHFWTWATNRMLHEKTFIFPFHGVVWIGSQNLTRGSWTLSKNRAVRIHSHPLATQLLNEWLFIRTMARPVLPIAQVDAGS
jgi:phosphatidylserine/phosphatidylglycerophosphate/cardiolipin synthase-like enzyme